MSCSHCGGSGWCHCLYCSQKWAGAYTAVRSPCSYCGGSGESGDNSFVYFVYRCETCNKELKDKHEAEFHGSYFHHHNVIREKWFCPECLSRLSHSDHVWLRFKEVYCAFRCTECRGTGKKRNGDTCDECYGIGYTKGFWLKDD